MPEIVAAVPALVQVSTPSLLTLAVVGAIAVIVWEARRLLRRLLAPPAQTHDVPSPARSEPRNTAGEPVRSEPALAVAEVAPREIGRLAAAVPAFAAPPLPAATPLPAAAVPSRGRRSGRGWLACLLVAGLAAAWLVFDAAKPHQRQE